jgi:hypothetical protein
MEWSSKMKVLIGFAKMRMFQMKKWKMDQLTGFLDHHVDDSGREFPYWTKEKGCCKVSN